MEDSKIKDTSLKSIRTFGNDIVTNIGKSSSDTAIMTKRTSHPKALSTHRLETHPQSTVTESTSESNSTLSDTKESDSNSDITFAATKNASSLQLNKERHPEVRHRKNIQSTRNRHKDIKEKDSNVKTSHLKESQSNRKTDVSDEDAEFLFEDEQTWKDSFPYYICWFILLNLSLATRIYNIERPAHVCWDETHFGKMGSWYINRTFFFDVHPPLGKMLIGLSGVLTGYDGSFPFHKPGDPYENANYVGMRVFCAVLGALLVPLAYQCVWLLTHSISASIFSAALILFDTGTTTLSRHILLDPILMFFIMTSTYSCLKFLTYHKSPFSFKWWLWLSLTGASLACALGVKFVGLFVILFVGYTTIADLWRLLGDRSLTLMMLSKHIAARVMALIIIPVIVYCALFAIHLKILDHSGNGDGFFSSAFQSQLIGNRLYNVSMPQHIAFGSEITLKQRRTGGAYLHSHFHLYPEELPPKQQQVTTYSHKDDNNRWKIKPADREIGPNEPLVYVQSGDLVRLEHVLTRRNLHSHKEPAPLSRHHYQVSGYGQNGTGDANDIWIVDVEGGSQGDKIQTVRSKIRFIHYHVRCLLHSHDKKLPKWGWEQLEVTCQPNLRDPTSLWSVEEVIDARLPNVSFEVYSPTFLEKLVESHAVMTQGNSGLKPKEGEVTSRPWQWPIDYRGQIFSGQDHRIYMLGNPVIFWSLLLIKVLFICLWLGFSAGRKRKIPLNKNLQTYCERTFRVCWWLLLAWLLHYAPFWSMSRVLYFHHYFPAFLYSAMFGGVVLDFLIVLICVCVPENLAIKVFHICFLVVAAGILWSFYLFHPLVYGMSGPLAVEDGSMMHKVKWLDSWDI
ncbi:hypothetical protein Btru_034988 [Bulinus truncatus]|nr:hypothetical protein Btru_034988 [Bulinus truncatus]